MAATDVFTPEVLWAQRSSATDESKNVIYLTITAADLHPETRKVEITPTAIDFYGESKTRKYGVKLELFAEIDPAQSTKHFSNRGVEFQLRKKEAKDEFWPRLLKESKKLQFVRTDFDKWVDEDEQDEAPAEENLAGGPGADAGDFGGLDFSKLGGGGGGMPDMSAMMGGMGGAGGPGGMDMAALQGMMGGAQGGEGEEEDDDDMPDLEEAPEEKKTEATEAK